MLLFRSVALGAVPGLRPCVTVAKILPQGAQMVHSGKELG